MHGRGLGMHLRKKHGRFAREFGWTDSSLVAGKRAIRLDSNLSDGYKALATAYNYRKDYEKAFPLLLKAVELNPTNDQAVGNLGTNYLLRGDLPEALRWEKKAAGMSPKNWIPYQLTGWIYRLLADLKNAESWFLKSLELNAMVYDTYELLGYAYVAQGRNQDALNLIPKVLEIKGNETRVLEAAGLIAHFAGDTKSAKKYFRESIEKNSSYKSDRNAVSPVGLGQILLEEGKTIEAEVYLTHAMENYLYEIENGSKSVDPPYLISVIYAIKENKELSLHWLQKAVDANWVDYNKFEYGPHFEKYRSDPDFRIIINGVRAKVDEMRKKAKEF
ncbi:MAG: tetratricopeptide repeat protein [Cytophagales bacterium]|nr:tetratricopeptide repeat protein [Cytophagales bacterium]